jgi:hypothetical protein
MLFALTARDERGQRLDPTTVRQSVEMLAGIGTSARRRSDAKTTACRLR